MQEPPSSASASASVIACKQSMQMILMMLSALESGLNNSCRGCVISSSLFVGLKCDVDGSERWMDRYRRLLSKTNKANKCGSPNMIWSEKCLLSVNVCVCVRARAERGNNMLLLPLNNCMLHLAFVDSAKLLKPGWPHIIARLDKMINNVIVYQPANSIYFSRAHFWQPIRGLSLDAEAYPEF